MKIALYGHFMYQLAVGLREVSDHEVRLFLDSRTLPNCLVDEPFLGDKSFACIEPWVSHRELLRPYRSELTSELSTYDVAITTDLGPIFANAAKVPYVIIPSGSDLTQWPFPIRARSTRKRGKEDLLAGLIAFRLRKAIRSAASIWGEGFSRFPGALERLDCKLGDYLLWPIDTNTFSPGASAAVVEGGQGAITIFHPTRMMFTPDPFLIESMGWKRNDLLIEGVAKALGQGVDVRLVLVDRVGSPDEAEARRLIDRLGIVEQVEWLTPENPEGYTWRQVVELYRSSDLVVDEFGGCLGLVALEGASCGRPVLNLLDSKGLDDVVESLYPDGHPFLQAGSVDEVCDVITSLTDRGLRTSVGRASRQWVLDHHERSMVAQRCEAMLRDLVTS